MRKNIGIGMLVLMALAIVGRMTFLAVGGDLMMQLICIVGGIGTYLGVAAWLICD